MFLKFYFLRKSSGFSIDKVLKQISCELDLRINQEEWINYKKSIMRIKYKFK